MTKKRIKAWAIVEKSSGEIEKLRYLPNKPNAPETLCVYWSSMFATYDGVIYGDGKRYRIVPVSITYQVPTKKKK